MKYQESGKQTNHLSLVDDVVTVLRRTVSCCQVVVIN